MSELYEKIVNDLYKYENISEYDNEQISKFINICMDAAADIAEKAMRQHGYKDNLVIEAIGSLKEDEK